MKVAEVIEQIKDSQCMTFHKSYDGSTCITIFDFCGFDENWNPLTPEEYNENEVNAFFFFLDTHCEACDDAFMYPHYTFEDGIISIEWESYGI